MYCIGLTGASIGHGQEERAVVLLGESLVLELFAVDGFAAGAVACSEVSALLWSVSTWPLVSSIQTRSSTNLDHELLNHTMEDGALVVQRLARLAGALLTSAETAEVLGRLGNEVGVELHGDAAGGLASEADVEEDARSRGLGVFRSHGFFDWIVRPECSCEWRCM